MDPHMDVPCTVNPTALTLVHVCHATGANGKTVTYNDSCISDLFAWNAKQQSASSNKEGMICPGLLVDRPASITNLSAAYYNNLVSSDPLLYSYMGCTCASPLVAYYHYDTSGMAPVLAHWMHASSRCCVWTMCKHVCWRVLLRR